MVSELRSAASLFAELPLIHIYYPYSCMDTVVKVAEQFPAVVFVEGVVRTVPN
jgi:hypothetical protein